MDAAAVADAVQVYCRHIVAALVSLLLLQGAAQGAQLA